MHEIISILIFFDKGFLFSSSLT